MLGVGLFIPTGWALRQKGSALPLGTHISKCLELTLVFPGGSVVKNPSAIQETRFQSLGQEDPGEEEMATLSRILDWEAHRQRSLAGCSLGSQGVQRDLPTKQQQGTPVSLWGPRAVVGFDPFLVSTRSSF